MSDDSAVKFSLDSVRAICNAVDGTPRGWLAPHLWDTIRYAQRLEEELKLARLQLKNCRSEINCPGGWRAERAKLRNEIQELKLRGYADSGVRVAQPPRLRAYATELE